MEALRLFVLWSCFTSALFTDPTTNPETCVIELECEECLPEHMPLVTSPRASGGVVRLAHGAELRLACPAGRFLLYPLRDALAAVCDRGRLRVRHDDQLRHLLELGCQENVFQDVMHEVEGCPSPLQGRAYQVQEGGGARHLATLCFDADGGRAAHAHACSGGGNALPLPPHRERSGPLSLLGNFNHMFDASTRGAAEKLYGDTARMNRRLRELLKHDDFTFAGQELVSVKLLSPHYFEDQNMRVTEFVSNKVAAWRSVAEGNLAHLQRDVAALLRGGMIHVHAGTYGIVTSRGGSGPERRALRLQGQRFPVPQYIWTVVHDPRANRAVALVLLNDPFIPVSEIRSSVFCESVCSSLRWLRELPRARRYETPLYGLVFCCNVHEFTAVVQEMPKDVFRDVPLNSSGLLTDTFRG